MTLEIVPWRQATDVETREAAAAQDPQGAQELASAETTRIRVLLAAVSRVDHVDVERNVDRLCPGASGLQRLLGRRGDPELVHIRHGEVVDSELLRNVFVAQRFPAPTDADLHEVLWLDHAQLERPCPL